MVKKKLPFINDIKSDLKVYDFDKEIIDFINKQLIPNIENLSWVDLLKYSVVYHCHSTLRYHYWRQVNLSLVDPIVYDFLQKSTEKAIDLLYKISTENKLIKGQENNNQNVIELLESVCNFGEKISYDLNKDWYTEFNNPPIIGLIDIFIGNSIVLSLKIGNSFDVAFYQESQFLKSILETRQLETKKIVSDCYKTIVLIANLGEARQIGLNLTRFCNSIDVNHEYIHRMVQNKILKSTNKNYMKEGTLEYALVDSSVGSIPINKSNSDFVVNYSNKKRKSFDDIPKKPNHNQKDFPPFKSSSAKRFPIKKQKSESFIVDEDEVDIEDEDFRKK